MNTPVCGAAPERGVWSKEEHDLFVDAVTQFPNGPWKAIAEHIGTRSVRQVQTHAQKYQEKVARRQRGLQKNRQKVVRTEHRVEEATFDFLQRPRAGKGKKRGKYNKRNTSARVVPIPPRPVRPTPSPPPAVASAPDETTAAITTPPCSSTPPTILEAAAAAASPTLTSAAARVPPSSLPLVDCVDKPEEAPLPSPNEVGSPDVFTDRATSPPQGLLVEAAGLFQLDTTPALPADDSTPTVPSPAPSLSSETIDSLFFDDIVAVEEAPEHALNVGAVPSLNDALDYFLTAMTVWGPGQGAASSIPSSGFAWR